MSLRIVLAAAAVLAFAAPAVAQEAPAAPPAEAPSAAEIAMEARGEAFKARMDQMQGEIEAAISGAGADQAKGMAEVDAILARYQPDIEGFIVDFEAFIDAEAGAEPDETKHAEMSGAKMGVRMALSGLPAQIRAGAQAALAAQVTVPAASTAAE
ncbi:hypothetical protein GCM10009116_26320 [Brevundimonas basaltis]|uniref:Translation initiation factor IF-2 n=1 Tax=Brevundimonas basaltis TaxID=472166 RepID=A0A7W8HZ75_9CAUL|nr:hypothetical protein [Brevundimonas basaltis]MBB5291647.1 hypothetical protein [Brevundimonas basaltis]